MKKDFMARIVSLNEVYQKSHMLAQLIMKSSIDFNLVIANARGGVFPARLIFDFLKYFSIHFHTDKALSERC